MAQTKSNNVDAKLMQHIHSHRHTKPESALAASLFRTLTPNPEKAKGAKKGDKESSNSFFSSTFKFDKEVDGVRSNVEAIIKPITSVNLPFKIGAVLSHCVAMMNTFSSLLAKMEATGTEYYIGSRKTKAGFKRLLSGAHFNLLKSLCERTTDKALKEVWREFTKITKNDVLGSIQFYRRMMLIHVPKLIVNIAIDIFSPQKIHGYNDVDIRITEYTDSEFVSICFGKKLQGLVEDVSSVQMADYWVKKWLKTSTKGDNHTATKQVTKLISSIVAKVNKISKEVTVPFNSKDGISSYNKLPEEDVPQDGWNTLLFRTMSRMVKDSKSSDDGRLSKNFTALEGELTADNINALYNSILELYCALSGKEQKFSALVGLQSVARCLKCDKYLLYMDAFAHVHAETVKREGGAAKDLNLYEQIEQNLESPIKSLDGLRYTELHRDQVVAAVSEIAASKKASDRAMNSFFKIQKRSEREGEKRRPLDLKFEQFLWKNKGSEIYQKCKESKEKTERKLRSVNVKAGKEIDSKQVNSEVKNDLPWIPSDKVLEEMSKEQQRFFSEYAAHGKDENGDRVEVSRGYVQKLAMIVISLFKPEAAQREENKKRTKSKAEKKEEEKLKRSINVFALAATIQTLPGRAPASEDADSDNEAPSTKRGRKGGKSRKEVAADEEDERSAKQDKKEKKRQEQQDEREEAEAESARRRRTRKEIDEGSDEEPASPTKSTNGSRPGSKANSPVTSPTASRRRRVVNDEDEE